jgi:type IV pilus assembly protein PilY1
MTHSPRSFRAIWLTTALGLAVHMGAGQAAAQGVDPGTAAKMPPNVLLIVDTSGSMEYEAGLDTFPTCTPGSATVNERSRWIDLVEVLSGTIPNYRCQQIDRSSTDLYRMGSTLEYPPDWQYRNPYHRPLNSTCGATPNTVPWSTNPTNAFDFVAPAFHPYNDNVTSCSFTQDPDGLIDTFSGSVRFGLMTFDTLPNDGDGFSGVAPLFSDGVAGAWSYFLSAGVTGWPGGCTSTPPMEVGARNGAAPTWEGRMIAFGNPAATSTGNTTRDTRIQQVLLSTRPY